MSSFSWARWFCREGILGFREPAWCHAVPSTGYFSIHIVIIRGAEIIPADPEELSSTFRAEMRPWRRGTTTAGVLQKELLAAF